MIIFFQSFYFVHTHKYNDVKLLCELSNFLIEFLLFSENVFTPLLSKTKKKKFFFFFCFLLIFILYSSLKCKLTLLYDLHLIKLNELPREYIMHCRSCCKGEQHKHSLYIWNLTLMALKIRKDKTWVNARAVHNYRVMHGRLGYMYKFLFLDRWKKREKTVEWVQS